MAMIQEPTEKIQAPTAVDLEREAAARSESTPVPSAPANEAVAMLIRRGFTPRPSRLDLPFPADLDGSTLDQLARHMGHYAFRLFFRGAILQHRKHGIFHPYEATRYVGAVQAQSFASTLRDLGLARIHSDGRCSLQYTANSFGPALEWYVAHEIRRTLGMAVAVGLKSGIPGVGGDLDVVAAAEGKLFYLELKSSPPKHLSDAEVDAFFARVAALRPDVALWITDTSLRLSDKVVPMLVAGMQRTWPTLSVQPTRVERELWALTPRLYAVNARPDLVLNIHAAVAAGLNHLSPSTP